MVDTRFPNEPLSHSVHRIYYTWAVRKVIVGIGKKMCPVSVGPSLPYSIRIKSILFLDGTKIKNLERFVISV